MKEQPTALRLADLLDLDPMPMGWCYEAATELRRLHAEVERLSLDGIHSCHAECQRPLCRLARERDALLEALKAFANEIVPNNPNDPIWVNARAAIKAVEEEA